MSDISTTLKHRTGVLFVLISALVFSLAGIFTKGVAADAWGVIFWRGLAAALFTFGYLAARGQLKNEVRAFHRPALAVTLMSALGTVAFILAFKLTDVANVALIYAAAPFVTAALAWVFIGERPTRLVVIASLAAFGGVCVIVAGSAGSGSLVGDMLAFGMTLMMAGIMVVYRRWPGPTAALPSALSSLVLLPVAAIFGAPLSVTPGELPILVLFGLVFAIASVTLSEGARRLPPAQTALLSALETPFAPVLAFIFLQEQPARATVIGGAVVLLAVVCSQVLAQRLAQRL